MAARDYRFEYMLLSRLQCGCNYCLGHGSRNAEHCLWAHGERNRHGERNKPIKRESFMACCQLNLSGLQENELMNSKNGRKIADII